MMISVISGKAITVGEELNANTTDGTHDKHVPFINIFGDEVKVETDSVGHPSLPARYIEWILLETETGFRIHYLKPGSKPEATNEYCDLHGLWIAKA